MLATSEGFDADWQYPEAIGTDRYPFTDPANSPRTKYLPRKMYTTRVGMDAIRALAICTFH